MTSPQVEGMGEASPHLSAAQALLPQKPSLHPLSVRIRTALDLLAHGPNASPAVPSCQSRSRAAPHSPDLPAQPPVRENLIRGRDGRAAPRGAGLGVVPESS